MAYFWIIGCGKFGSRAVARLKEKIPDAVLTVVDPDPLRLAPWYKQAETVVQDGVSFLVQRLKSGPLPEWIIAAAPIHVAYGWVLNTVKQVNLKPIPIPELPLFSHANAVRGKEGEVFLTYADFLCPEDCPEPPDRCTVTGISRNRNLYDLVEGFHLPGWSAAVLKSRLILPGVGGYAPESLLKLKSRIESLAGNILIGTACRCHGVLHGARVTRNGSSR